MISYRLIHTHTHIIAFPQTGLSSNDTPVALSLTATQILVTTPLKGIRFLRETVHSRPRSVKAQGEARLVYKVFFVPKGKKC